MNTVANRWRRVAGSSKRKRRSLTARQGAAPIRTWSDGTSPRGDQREWCGDLTRSHRRRQALLATVEDLACARARVRIGEHHDAHSQGALCMRGGARRRRCRRDLPQRQGRRIHRRLSRRVRRWCHQSMGRVGSALDNAAAESLTRRSSGNCWHADTSRPKTGRKCVFIDRYNHRRRHSHARCSTVAYDRSSPTEPPTEPPNKPPDRAAWVADVHVGG